MVVTFALGANSPRGSQNGHVSRLNRIRARKTFAKYKKIDFQSIGISVYFPKFYRRERAWSAPKVEKKRYHHLHTMF